jgi:hypothetical protein
MQQCSFGNLHIKGYITEFKFQDNYHLLNQNVALVSYCFSFDTITWNVNIPCQVTKHNEVGSPAASIGCLLVLSVRQLLASLEINGGKFK